MKVLFFVETNNTSRYNSFNVYITGLIIIFFPTVPGGGGGEEKGSQVNGSEAPMITQGRQASLPMLSGMDT